MFQLVFTNKFNKDVKLLQKRGYNMELFKKAILLLEATGNLPVEYNPPKLVGIYTDYWEAHLRPDWLIIWKLVIKENAI